jgi:hypothetical protein
MLLTVLQGFGNQITLEIKHQTVHVSKAMECDCETLKPWYGSGETSLQKSRAFLGWLQ